jgi:hypothetical protein
VVAPAFQRVGDRDVGAQLEPPGADAHGGLARILQRGCDVVTLARAVHGQPDPRFGLALLVAELGAQGKHLLGGPFRLLVTVLVPQRPAELAQDLGAEPGRAAGQAQCRLQVLDRSVEQTLVAEDGAP